MSDCDFSNSYSFTGDTTIYSWKLKTNNGTGTIVSDPTGKTIKCIDSYDNEIGCQTTKLKHYEKFILNNNYVQCNNGNIYDGNNILASPYEPNTLFRSRVLLGSSPTPAPTSAPTPTPTPP